MTDFSKAARHSDERVARARVGSFHMTTVAKRVAIAVQTSPKGKEKAGSPVEHELSMGMACKKRIHEGTTRTQIE